MKEKETAENEEESFWAGGNFSETLSSEDLQERMKTLHKSHDDDMNFKCKKCGNAISAHKKDWHNGMCDICFNREYFPEGQANTKKEQ